MKMRFVFLALALVVGTACGGDSTEPKTPTYENITGTYSTAVAETVLGIELDATFVLTVTQSDSTLGGRYELSGTVTDALAASFPVRDSGSVAGTIMIGEDPDIDITITSEVCVNGVAAFYGIYDSQDGALVLDGWLKIYDSECESVTYWGTYILVGA